MAYAVLTEGRLNIYTTIYRIAMSIYHSRSFLGRAIIPEIEDVGCG